MVHVIESRRDPQSGSILCVRSTVGWTALCDRDGRAQLSVQRGCAPSPSAAGGALDGTPKAVRVRQDAIETVAHQISLMPQPSKRGPRQQEPVFSPSKGITMVTKAPPCHAFSAAAGLTYRCTRGPLPVRASFEHASKRCGTVKCGEVVTAIDSWRGAGP